MGVEYCRRVDSAVVATLLAVLASVFLLFRREASTASWNGGRVVSVATYFVATFLGTYGSVAAATILVLPILLYGRLLTHLGNYGLGFTFLADIRRVLIESFGSRQM